MLFAVFDRWEQMEPEVLYKYTILQKVFIFLQICIYKGSELLQLHFTEFRSTLDLIQSQNCCFLASAKISLTPTFTFSFIKHWEFATFLS